MSGPEGRVIRGDGKDTAGFGGGTDAPPADMLLRLLRLRAAASGSAAASRSRGGGARGGAWARGGARDPAP